MIRIVINTYTNMGCNFYLRDETSLQDDNAKRCIPQVDKQHVGKRCAAGYYCWDCNISLCSKGQDYVHGTTRDNDWLDFCPMCGKQKEYESLEMSSMGRELGFNPAKGNKKSGVRSCSSFNWGMYPKDLRAQMKANPNLRITSEYFDSSDPSSDIYTLEEFEQEILSECPINFFSYVGMDFS